MVSALQDGGRSRHTDVCVCVRAQLGLPSGFPWWNGEVVSKSAPTAPISCQRFLAPTICLVGFLGSPRKKDNCV